MADNTQPAPSKEPPYALGWASATIAALATVTLPAPGQMGFRYEAMATVSTFIGAAAAVGVGLGIRALLARVRPLVVAWVGLLGNAGVVVFVAVRLAFWLPPAR